RIPRPTCVPTPAPLRPAPHPLMLSASMPSSLSSSIRATSPHIRRDRATRDGACPRPSTTTPPHTPKPAPSPSCRGMEVPEEGALPFLRHQRTQPPSRLSTPAPPHAPAQPPKPNRD